MGHARSTIRLTALVALFVLAAGMQTGAGQPLDLDHRLIDDDGPTDPWAKMVGDVDGDGLPDVVIGGRNGPLVWYEAPDWTKHLIADGGYETVDGELGDVNGDGNLDVIMGGLIWYENPGDTSPDAWTSHRIAEHATHDVEVGDLDGDGRLDVVTRDQSAFSDPSGDEIHVWLQKASDRWTQVVLSSPHGEGVRVSDLDDDGQPDIVIGGYWYRNGGQPSDAGGWTRHRYGDWHPNASVAVADMNDDGRRDIVLTPAELEDNYYRISWFEAPMDRTTEAWTAHAIDTDVEAVYHSLEAADMNGDGAMDVVTAEMHQSEDPDEVVIYVNQQSGSSFEKQVLSEKGSHLLQVHDVGNDGDMDVVGANWSGDYQPIEWWEN